jgi:trehalose 6-phosphate phosphatase
MPCHSWPVGDLVRSLADSPERAAILLDVDGVLAPIVLRPEDSRVPDETRAEVERLAGRYAVVACVSGRTSADAERLVGVPRVVYLGSHGLELAPEAEEWRGRMHRFASGVDWPVEDKGLTVSFHYRGLPDEQAARARLEQVAEEARAEGLLARFGRKVLELRPPIQADKGTAVQALLTDRGLRRALYIGDDTTDLDGFRGLDGLELAIRVAASSPEGPPELLEAADVVVDGPEGALALLRRL